MDIQATLVSIWREACRHIEITESAAAIAQVLSSQMTFQALIVRRLDLGQMQLQTVAVAPKAPPGLSPRTTPLSRATVSRLLDWFSRRILWKVPQDGPFDGLDVRELFGDIHAPMLIGGLLAGQTPTGILAVVGEPGLASFSEEDANLVRQLLEPFAVALENDQRLREMATLREAAEAEKRSLLARLGRQSLSDAIVGAETGVKDSPIAKQSHGGPARPRPLPGQPGCQAGRRWWRSARLPQQRGAWRRLLLALHASHRRPIGPGQPREQVETPLLDGLLDDEPVHTSLQPEADGLLVRARDAEDLTAGSLPLRKTLNAPLLPSRRAAGCSASEMSMVCRYTETLRAGSTKAPSGSSPSTRKAEIERQRTCCPLPG